MIVVKSIGALDITKKGDTMKFEEAIKIAGKEYIKEVMQQETQEEKLSIKFRINMWWMFRKYSFLNKNGTK